jgi:hypothetical protein
MEKKEVKKEQVAIPELKLPEGCFRKDCYSCNDAKEFANPNQVKCGKADKWIKIPGSCPF